MDADVIIVGGGIGGAVLAHLLTDRGRRVIVLERAAQPVRVERPEVLWPPTLRVLAPILGPERLAAATRRVAGLRFFRSGKVLLKVDVPPQSKHPAAGVSFTDPNQTRQMLLDDPRFDLRRGVAIAALLRDAGGRVTGVRTRDVASGDERDLAASTVIGDDGTHSVVRQQCGIRCDITQLPADLLTFGVEWPAELPNDVAHLFINDRWSSTGLFAMAAAPFPSGRGAALVPARPWALADPLKAAAGWQVFLDRNALAARFFDPAHRRFPQDLFRVRTGFGLATHFGAPGVFLMGDAAHPVTPAGGQGANLSIHDAVALAEILTTPNHPEPLADYERRRRPAAKRSIALSRGVTRALGLPDAIISHLLPTALRFINRFPAPFARALRTPATAFTSAP
jgi:2-polyprenyl-6-methoxyphenol hydroxylase-like FAD-dependent oxidoreductase